MRSKAGYEYPVKQVDYVEDYTVNLDDLSNSDGEIPMELINQLFFKKTSRWANEHEYRIVRPLSDSDDYKQPLENYPYVDDSGIYLFPLDLNYISSVILGAYMSIENKIQIAKYCENYGISLSQAIIVRDIKDYLGKPSTVYIHPYDQLVSREGMLNAKPQTLCTDTVRWSNQNTQRICKITELPYYKGHEEIVEKLLQNMMLSKNEWDSMHSSL